MSKFKGALKIKWGWEYFSFKESFDSKLLLNLLQQSGKCAWKQYHLLKLSNFEANGENKLLNNHELLFDLNLRMLTFLQ